MTKSELIDKLVEANSVLSRKESEAIISIVFDSMSDALKSGEKVEIRGFGSFTIRARDAREARNPKSGELVKIPSKKTPFFKTGKELRERVNCA
ncbi:integration host factor, beta subunit [Geotalea daltonii FRC-32]|uniref:Integration host factor, beta subunit n=1 Tax=Geotalea daltonii (strain DSM 22248 / JCM 15807 / FRC-32) TaxID=316067 RepID=B9LZG6_GEODF|nr:integration host factor subunit beta [Geotalea daltonii]ACM20719.1 integration host factor, beta subunit [Geotalea daltonii FRC-32]